MPNSKLRVFPKITSVRAWLLYLKTLDYYFSLLLIMHFSLLRNLVITVDSHMFWFRVSTNVFKVRAKNVLEQTFAPIHSPLHQSCMCAL